ncbi:zinc-dependent alcohol dehydrogenase family protein [Nisaea nitritireducens]|uniref:zinc-dependent alcohol dehydrogenase family protein n=1 Tax=Nisaea nitritireducens TaxID=568392 RepID=UPI0018662C2E|nr:NAD(P)-dependent alcohol dehydrogenase [Nisaea nitritireducens]
MKAYEIVSDGGVDALALNDRPDPKPGPGEVLVRVRASSINYRDLSTVEAPVPRGIPYPRIPNSDGAGDVVEVGPGVTRWKAGDKVCGCFFQGWVDGDITPELMGQALGGTIDGMLTEYRVLGEGGLVAMPEHLSYEEASTLPCAALTAWVSLVHRGGVKAGDTVLLLGTGGVSVFALQFCKLMGVKTICTSSSDEKIARLKAMGADEVINYRTHPEWQEKVLELTDGRGVDHTVEVGGAGTLERSIAATRVAGSIGLIGVLTGGEINPVNIMRKSIRLQGIYVGSRRVFEDMNAAISQHGLKPVISDTFAFEDARDAFHAMRAAGHFGKLVVKT